MLVGRDTHITTNYPRSRGVKVSINKCSNGGGAQIRTRKRYYLPRKKKPQACIKLGRDALFDLLRMRHLLIHLKRACYKTTHSYHLMPVLSKWLSLDQNKSGMPISPTYQRVRNSLI